ncbi:MAG: homoserine kinase [Actinomycetota bacterium]
MRITVRVPATSANLGPGFDCLGLALQLHNEVTVDTSAGGITWEGEGAEELSSDGTDMVTRAMRHVAEQAGAELPGLGLRSLNRIPLERGLGSSSAAVVAGVVLADALLGTELDERQRLEAAVAVEGHPDNVAPALSGGLVLSYPSVEGGWRAERLSLAAGIRAVALIPLGERIPTEEARRALPTDVPFGDAVFNVSRAALVTVALSSSPELLGEALQDRLHQDARLALVPQARAVFDRLRDDGVPVCVSGAGPTLLAFERDGGREVPDLGDGWRILRVVPDLDGAIVTQG